MIDPMDDGDDPDDMLTPEEESLVQAREFGRTDRLNPEAKQKRLQELNSQFPTRQDMQAALDALESSAGKGLLSMATCLHDELEGLITEELAEKTTKLRFNSAPAFDSAPECDDDDAEEATEETYDTDIISISAGPISTIGVLLADRPEAVGHPNRCVVHGSVPGSPAYFSGKMKPGDLIMQVDGEDVRPDNVVGMMRGNDVPGTRIKLLIERAGRRRPFAVHLNRASKEVVARKKKAFDLLATLAQAAGASSLEQDAERDDSTTAMHREMIGRLKQMEREHVGEHIILQEQAERMTRALRQAQFLIQEFFSKGQGILQSEAGASDRPLPLPEGPNTASEPSTSQEGSKSPQKSGWLVSLLGAPAPPEGIVSVEHRSGDEGLTDQEVEAIVASVMPSGDPENAVVPVAGGDGTACDATETLKMLTKNLRSAEEQLKHAEARCNKLTEENATLSDSLRESMTTLQEMRSQAQDKAETQKLYDAVKHLLNFVLSCALHRCVFVLRRKALCCLFLSF